MSQDPITFPSTKMATCSGSTLELATEEVTEKGNMASTMTESQRPLFETQPDPQS